MNLKFKLTKIYLIIPFLWVISVLSFLNYLSIPFNILMILIPIYLVTVVYKLENSIYFLPYLVVLSPIFGSIVSFFGFNLLLSDLIILFSFFYLLFSRGIKSVKSKKTFFILSALFFFTLFHFIIGDLISLKPVFSIFEIFIVYYLTINTIDNINKILFLNHFCYSVLIGIMLMFLAFYNGINLNDYSAGDGSKLFSEAKQFNAANFRMSYFYTNFPLLISSSVFVYLYKLGTYKNYIKKFFSLIIIVLVSIALVASGNKTTMYTTLIVFFISNILFRNIGIYRFKTFIYPIMFLPLIYYLVFNYYLDYQNIDGFVKVMSSLDSVIDRFGVYGNAILILLENSLRLLIGFGPDFLTCCGDPELSRLIKGNIINIYKVNNAVDSGIFTFIIEFGVIPVIMVLVYFKKHLKKLAKTQVPINILFVQFFLIILIYSILQLIGLSKITWIIVVFFVLSKNYKINYLKS
jgi:hypothetical protein